MSHRIQQLQSTLQREVSRVLAAGLSDPRVRGLISVTSVKINTETRTATVGVCVLPAEAEKLTLHGLNAAARFIQGEVAKRIRSGSSPRLQFVVDEATRREMETLLAIDRGMERERLKEAQSTDEAPGDGVPTDRDDSQDVE